MTKTVFLRNDTVYQPVPASSLVPPTPVEKLPGGNFIIKFDMKLGFYFERTDDFVLPSKLYGGMEKQAARIWSTFMSRPSGTGVMLNGEKGSGKTLLTKLLARDAAALGVPTLLVNAPMAGDDFAKLLQDLEPPAIVLFDEFEKIYDEETQERVLTVFDGVFPSKKLFLLTCNDRYRVNTHMHNRPGRMFYSISYDGISPEFVAEYAQDNLKNKSHVDSVVQVASLFYRFNFDMLKALIEEMNRYDETAQDAIKMLNAEPGSESNEYFDVTMSLNGQALPFSDVHAGSPMARSELRFVVYPNGRAKPVPRIKPRKDGLLEFIETNIARGQIEVADEPISVARDDAVCVVFTPHDLVGISTTTPKTFTYTNAEGYTAVFTKQLPKASGFDQFLDRPSTPTYQD